VKYWINTISREHVLLGVEGGFTQADHGKATRLARLAQGDLIAFYSPRTAYPAGEPLQAFTALGRVTDERPYQVTMSASFHPWRRRVAFVRTGAAPIQPLIAELSFIADKQRWGFPFRRGLFAVEERDFVRIAEAMGATLPLDSKAQ
jgi:hypothetical protein